MKKRFVIAAGLLLIGSMTAHADTAGDLKKESKLVTLNASSGKMNQLERRIDTLEKELHDQRDSIRSLERDLSDLRRRR